MSKFMTSVIIRGGINFLGKHLLNREGPLQSTIDASDPASWTYTGSQFSFSEGTFSSTNHSHRSTSSMSMTVPLLSFIRLKWRVSSEGGWDYINIYINGERVIRRSGDSGWTDFNYTVDGEPLENATIKIEYYKDGSVSRGEDRCQVKDIVVSGPTVFGPPPWRLMHQFASNTGAPPYPNEVSLNGAHEAINTHAKLDAAGITHSLSHYNYSGYTRPANYLQAFRSGSPQGYIEVTMPVGFTEMKVEWGNWYSGHVFLKVNGTTIKTLSPNQKADVEEFACSSGSKVRIQEDGILFVKAIWVR